MCERDHARLSSVRQNKREVKLYFIIISEQQKSRRSKLLVRSWSTEPEAFERLLCLVTPEPTSSVRKHQLNILRCLSAVGQKLMMVFSIVSSRSGVVSSLWRNCSSVNQEQNYQPESDLNPVWGCSRILYVKLYYFISIYYFAIFVEINIQLILPKRNLALSDEGGAMSEKCWILEMSWSRPVSAHYAIFPLHLPAWLCSVSPQQIDEGICRY